MHSGGVHWRSAVLRERPPSGPRGDSERNAMKATYGERPNGVQRERNAQWSRPLGGSERSDEAGFVLFVSACGVAPVRLNKQDEAPRQRRDNGLATVA